MSKPIESLKREEERMKKSIAAAKKKLKAAEEKLEVLHRRWPFKCSKCKMAFEPEELAYKTWHRIWNNMNCQYGGEYDIRQIEDHRHIACCPSCGHSFNVEVKKPDIMHETRTYSRWEDKPDFQKCCEECISKKPKKLEPGMVKYILSRKHEDWC